MHAYGGVCFSSQEQALQTSFFGATIEKEDVDPKCRICGKEVGSVWLAACGCIGLAQREYWRKHDWMVLRMY